VITLCCLPKLILSFPVTLPSYKYTFLDSTKKKTPFALYIVTCEKTIAPLEPLEPLESTVHGFIKNKNKIIRLQIRATLLGHATGAFGV